MTKKWTASDTSRAKDLGYLEFNSNDNDCQYFQVLQLGDRLVFGNPTNNTFLESGYILRDETEHVDNCLHELEDELKAFYNDGPQFTNRIVYNERM